MNESWRTFLWPLLVACVVSDADHSFAALCATKECLIAIPAVAPAPKWHLSGTSGCAAVSTCAESEV